MVELKNAKQARKEELRKKISAEHEAPHTTTPEKTMPSKLRSTNI